MSISQNKVLQVTQKIKAITSDRSTTIGVYFSHPPAGAGNREKIQMIFHEDGEKTYHIGVYEVKPEDTSFDDYIYYGVVEFTDIKN